MTKELKKYHRIIKGKNVKHRVLLFVCFYFLSAAACFGAALPAAQAYNRSIRLAASGNYSAAMKAAKTTADPKLIKLIEWFRLTDSKQIPDFADAQNFIKKNPDWPRIYLIRRNAELALLETGKTGDLEKWFKQHPPVSVKAVLTYADILMKKKDWEKALPMLHSLWAKGDLDEEETQLVQEKLFFLLDERDFANRAKKLLNERKASLARRFIPFMPDYIKRLALTRADLIANKKNARKDINELPENQRRDEGFLFDLVRWLRTNKRYSAAAKLLEKIPPEKQRTSRWWTEKSILIRQFLADKKYHAAYSLAKNHYLTKGADFADAEWTAGWIALQNLKKKDLAVQHFKNMLKAVSSPLSVSRGEYWLGRAYEEKNDSQQARLHYEKAARNITTIYGQLAAGKLNRPLTPLPPEKQPDKALIDKFRKSELFAVMKMLENAGQYDLVGLFATRLFLDAADPQSVTALAYVLTHDLKREDLAVTIARRARQNGIDMIDLGYPVRDLKHDKRAETAVVLSIIRQESSFSPYAVSSAGARGLMQIMPATAKQVARKKRKSFSVQELNSNPDFNVELGSTYFADLLKRFNGSYILAIAAYNAGPTNVNRWLRSIGHPQKDMDPIDWIERIPFNETRNYVQRVLENLHIYRRHLNCPEQKLNSWQQQETPQTEN